jgi:hypothetical protein
MPERGMRQNARPSSPVPRDGRERYEATTPDNMPSTEDKRHLRNFERWVFSPPAGLASKCGWLSRSLGIYSLRNLKRPSPESTGKCVYCHMQVFVGPEPGARIWGGINLPR